MPLRLHHGRTAFTQMLHMLGAPLGGSHLVAHARQTRHRQDTQTRPLRTLSSQASVARVAQQAPWETSHRRRPGACALQLDAFACQPGLSTTREELAHELKCLEPLHIRYALRGRNRSSQTMPPAAAIRRFSSAVCAINWSYRLRRDPTASVFAMMSNRRFS